jgi:3-deoxy-D-manno-octulosonate 8-phosphate phosphatase (KDO 8-P phosphatase)
MNKPNFIPHPAEALVLARTTAALRKRLAQIKLMVFDVDGVLTDGSLWYGEQGEMFKRFHALDGHGLKMLTSSGIKVALVTGREGPIVDRRAAELGLGDIMQNVRDKGTALNELVARHRLTLEEAGFMGDDLIDLPAMQRAGFAASVRMHQPMSPRPPTGPRPKQAEKGLCVNVAT